MYILVVYTGFTKAFDKCDHKVIAYKLRKIRILGKIGRCMYSIYNILVGHTKSHSKGEMSERVSVTSLMPQAAALAPILFIKKWRKQTRILRDY